MMCNIYGIFIVVLTTAILQCCDVARGFVLSESYFTDPDKSAQDLVSWKTPGLYKLMRRFPQFPSGDGSGNDFEALKLGGRGGIRLSVDDTGGFDVTNRLVPSVRDVTKRMTPPAREWCRIVGYDICRRSN